MGLGWVRKIEKLDFTHIIASALIVITMIVVVIYAGVDMGKDGSHFKEVYFWNPKTWFKGIGFAVYAYEGIGIIMPVQDITAHPKSYMTIVFSVMITVSAVFLAFGQICAIAWGNEMNKPLVTDMLPSDPKTNPHDAWFGWTIKVLFCINLIFSFPLILFPAHRVIENYIYNDWPKSPKR